MFPFFSGSPDQVSLRCREDSRERTSSKPIITATCRYRSAGWLGRDTKALRTTLCLVVSRGWRWSVKVRLRHLAGLILHANLQVVSAVPRVESPRVEYPDRSLGSRREKRVESRIKLYFLSARHSLIHVNARTPRSKYFEAESSPQSISR